MGTIKRMKRNLPSVGPLYPSLLLEPILMAMLLGSLPPELLSRLQAAVSGPGMLCP